MYKNILQKQVLQHPLVCRHQRTNPTKPQKSTHRDMSKRNQKAAAKLKGHKLECGEGLNRPGSEWSQSEVGVGEGGATQGETNTKIMRRDTKHKLNATPNKEIRPQLLSTRMLSQVYF